MSVTIEIVAAVNVLLHHFFAESMVTTQSGSQPSIDTTSMFVLHTNSPPHFKRLIDWFHAPLNTK